jgi:hypothetical protein
MPTPNMATKATAIGRRRRASARRMAGRPEAARAGSRGSARHSTAQASKGSTAMPYSGALRLICDSQAAAAGPSTSPRALDAPEEGHRTGAALGRHVVGDQRLADGRDGRVERADGAARQHQRQEGPDHGGRRRSAPSMATHMAA